MGFNQKRLFSDQHKFNSPSPRPLFLPSLSTQIANLINRVLAISGTKKRLTLLGQSCENLNESSLRDAEERNPEREWKKQKLLFNLAKKNWRSQNLPESKIAEQNFAEQKFAQLKIAQQKLPNKKLPNKNCPTKNCRTKICPTKNCPTKKCPTKNCQVARVAIHRKLINSQ